MGALGVAILAKSVEKKQEFNFNITDFSFETKGVECKKCANNCEIVCFYKDNNLLDSWGNKCDNGAMIFGA